MSGPRILSIGDIKRILAERNLRPRRRLGQHFMVDRSALMALVDRAELTSTDVVLEPGAGPGNLTALLSDRAGWVVAVELDESLCAVAAERLSRRKNITLLRADIMEDGDRINPLVRKAISDSQAALGGGFKVVANLPYCIATALVTALLLEEPVPERIVVTVQKEVADRLTASPGSRDYGYISVMVQAVAEARRIRILSPRCFWPEPDVEGALVLIRPDSARRPCRDDLARLQRAASRLFTHRRKQLVGALVQSGLAPDRASALRLCEASGVKYSSRAEELTVADLLALSRALEGQATPSQ